MFTLTIVIELFSSLLYFFFLLVSSCFFCLVVSFCMYVYLSTFLEGGGGGFKIKKSAYVLEGWGLSKNEQGQTRGLKVAKFERTYFLNAPLKKWAHLESILSIENILKCLEFEQINELISGNLEKYAVKN